MDMKNYTAKQNVRGCCLATCKTGRPTRDYCSRKFGKKGVPNAKNPLNLCSLVYGTVKSSLPNRHC